MARRRSSGEAPPTHTLCLNEEMRDHTTIYILIYMMYWYGVPRRMLDHRHQNEKCWNVCAMGKIDRQTLERDQDAVSLVELFSIPYTHDTSHTHTRQHEQTGN